MNGLVLGVFVALGLVACTEDPAGGSDGAGGIQAPEAGATTTSVGGGEPSSTSGQTSSSEGSGTGGGSGGGSPSSSGSGGGGTGGGECAPSDAAIALCEGADEACGLTGYEPQCLANIGEGCEVPECKVLHETWVACLEDESSEVACVGHRCKLPEAYFKDCANGPTCNIREPDDQVVCAYRSDCAVGPLDIGVCILGNLSERCLYSDGSECREKFDAHITCLVEVIEAQGGPECPDAWEQCADLQGDYLSSCV